MRFFDAKPAATGSRASRLAVHDAHAAYQAADYFGQVQDRSFLTTGYVERFVANAFGERGKCDPGRDILYVSEVQALGAVPVDQKRLTGERLLKKELDDATVTVAGAVSSTGTQDNLLDTSCGAE